jgi:hypothetical protein
MQIQQDSVSGCVLWPQPLGMQPGNRRPLDTNTEGPNQQAANEVQPPANFKYVGSPHIGAADVPTRDPSNDPGSSANQFTGTL